MAANAMRYKTHLPDGQPQEQEQRGGSTGSLFMVSPPFSSRRSQWNRTPRRNRHRPISFPR